MAPASTHLSSLFARLEAIREWFGSTMGRRLTRVASLLMSAAIIGLLVQAIVAVELRRRAFRRVRRSTPNRRFECHPERLYS